MISRTAIALSLFVTTGTLEAQSQLRHYEFDSTQSQLFVVTHRSGVLAGLFGHEHAITANRWAGAFCWSADAAASAHGFANVDARSLEIDTEAGRKLAGLGSSPSDGQLKTIRKKFVDEQHLDTARYAQMRLDLPTITKAEGDRLNVKGRLTIRGVTRDVAFPLQVRTQGDESVRVTGTLTVRQSEFGIKPESIAGVVKVKDPIDIRINAIGKATQGACPIGNTP